MKNLEEHFHKKRTCDKIKCILRKYIDMCDIKLWIIICLEFFANYRSFKVNSWLFSESKTLFIIV